MKILVLSVVPWSNNNNLGNTLTNIFENLDDIEFANIYLGSGLPDNNICSLYYQIDEKQLLRGENGKVFTIDTCDVGKNKNASTFTRNEQKLYDLLRKQRFFAYFIAREIIWKLLYQNRRKLEDFVESFNPDIIFCLINKSVYFNSVCSYIKKFSNKPMIGYIWDDIYSYKNLNPFYNLYQFYVRKSIRNIVTMCNWLYTISEIQKKDCEREFKIDCKLLWKSMNFDKNPERMYVHHPLKLLYTGNIGLNRYKSLAMIGRALKNINANETKAELDIYTMTPISSKIKKELNIPGCVNIKGAVSISEVYRLQKEADILVHVEAMDKNSIRNVRQSFSTKLVDYFYNSKCIFAVGPIGVASIDYLRKNDAAIIANNQMEIERELQRLCDDVSICREYGEKAWLCGKNNHDRKITIQRLRNDFNSL